MIYLYGFTKLNLQKQDTYYEIKPKDISFPK